MPLLSCNFHYQLTTSFLFYIFFTFSLSPYFDFQIISSKKRVLWFSSKEYIFHREWKYFPAVPTLPDLLFFVLFLPIFLTQKMSHDIQVPIYTYVTSILATILFFTLTHYYILFQKNQPNSRPSSLITISSKHITSSKVNDPMLHQFLPLKHFSSRCP